MNALSFDVTREQPVSDPTRDHLRDLAHCLANLETLLERGPRKEPLHGAGPIGIRDPYREWQREILRALAGAKEATQATALQRSNGHARVLAAAAKLRGRDRGRIRRAVGL